MDSPCILDKAINLARQAVEADKNHRYQEALQLYGDAAEQLMISLKQELTEKEHRDKCLCKIQEYLGRANKIKEALKKHGENIFFESDVATQTE